MYAKKSEIMSEAFFVDVSIYPNHGQTLAQCSINIETHVTLNEFFAQIMSHKHIDTLTGS